MCNPHTPVQSYDDFSHAILVRLWTKYGWKGCPKSKPEKLRTQLVEGGVRHAHESPRVLPKVPSGDHREMQGAARGGRGSGNGYCGLVGGGGGGEEAYDIIGIRNIYY